MRKTLIALSLTLSPFSVKGEDFRPDPITPSFEHLRGAGPSAHSACWSKLSGRPTTLPSLSSSPSRLVCAGDIVGRYQESCTGGDLTPNATRRVTYTFAGPTISGGITAQSANDGSIYSVINTKLGLAAAAYDSDSRCSSAPAVAAAVGYNMLAMNIERWSLSMIDLRTLGSGFLWYNDGYSGVPGAENSALSVVEGQLVIAGAGGGGHGGIGTAAAKGTPTLKPNANFVGAAFGPGFYMEAEVMFSPNSATSINWPALWGNTFHNFFNETAIGGVELDWAEFPPGGFRIPAYNVALHDWDTIGGSSRTASYGNNGDTPALPAGFNFNTMHLYAVLVVPSQNNNGTGYAQTYVDGNPYFKVTWTAGRAYSRLDTTPFIPVINPGPAGPITVGRVRIFVAGPNSIVRPDQR